MKFAVEVLTVGDPAWYRNQRQFETEAEAMVYGIDLSTRWTAVVDWRVATLVRQPEEATK